ncbi:J domain-containing protein [Pseudarthrobacter sp. J1738]|uniref:J domain-containing protein n=1 Tax=unclassified Pseudarthrobacter TaxID=2647000 RepID=UPI003D2D5FF7
MSKARVTHYEILGVPITATTQEIKVAYRKQARRTHPDHGGDPATFRLVTLAFETLSDPKRRAAYDGSYGAGSVPRTTAEKSGYRSSSGHSSGTAGFTAHGVRRPAPRVSATDPAVFVPPFPTGAPGEDPSAFGTSMIPEAMARQQMHGLPRKRGIFGAEARIAREMRTVQLLVRGILSEMPSARLINGLVAPHNNSHIDHALLVGYRLALIDSMLLPPGVYGWNGDSLNRAGRLVKPPRLAPSLRSLQDAFPELNVTAWTVIHSPDGAIHQPVIDDHRGGSEIIAPEVVNAAGLIRGLKHFLGSGPVPNTVDVPILARLIKGMH